uniref:Uncharacterized protein n=1 Tax=Arundo donax TaxID=35708 RepID=A0A0A9ALK5_ARUDO
MSIHLSSVYVVFITFYVRAYASFTMLVAFVKHIYKTLTDISLGSINNDSG